MRLLLSKRLADLKSALGKLMSWSRKVAKRRRVGEDPGPNGKAYRFLALIQKPKSGMRLYVLWMDLRGCHGKEQ